MCFVRMQHDCYVMHACGPCQAGWPHAGVKAVSLTPTVCTAAAAARALSPEPATLRTASHTVSGEGQAISWS